MARRPEGWKLSFDERRGVYYVRWTHRGVRRNESTGTGDPDEAAAEAARRYAEAVSGRRSTATRERTDVAAARWIGSLDGSLDEETIAKYEQYARAWATTWSTLEHVTGQAIEDWWRARLREVTRKTVIKQLYALNGFLRWCRTQGMLVEVPTWEAPPRSATGTRPETRAVVEVVPLSPAEAERILAALPVRTGRARTGEEGEAGRSWVRDRFRVAWETALRPATIGAIRVPDDYRPGAAALRIEDEDDKSRFGREVPLTPAACKALDRCAPELGLVFGPLDSHTAARYLRDAAKRAGIPAERAERIKAYDLRHARLTQLAEAGNLVGLAYLAGHKAITTTNRYVHAHREAALEVLGFRPHSGRGRKGGGAGGR